MASTILVTKYNSESRSKVGKEFVRLFVKDSVKSRAVAAVRPWHGTFWKVFSPEWSFVPGSKRTSGCAKNH